MYPDGVETILGQYWQMIKKNIKGQHEAVRIRKAVRPAGRNQLKYKL
jgi:hypothetical protein